MNEGSQVPTPTASYSGFVNGETLATSDVTGAPSLTTTATTASAPGTSTITAGKGGLASNNYAFSFVNGTLTVYDVAPVILMSTGTITLSPGDGFTRPGSFSDPGTAVPTETWTMTVSYGDGSPSTAPTSPGNFSLGHTYAGSGTYTVTLTVADNYGGSEALTFSVQVLTPPVLSSVTTQSVAHNTPLSLNFSFSDTANTSGYTYSINWGDPGSGTDNTQSGPTSMVNSAGTGTFAGSHTYHHKGTYTVFVTVTDALGENVTISFQVIVS
jgi:hypothetical protein